MSHNSNHELSHWLHITQVPGLGARSIQKLLAQFHTVEAITKASIKQLEYCQLNEVQIHELRNPNQKLIDDALLWQSKPHQQIIPFTDARYPQLLRETSCFPAILYIHGDWRLLSQPQIAIVGSRKPTYTGLELAGEFARELSAAGFVVTSGLALGVDGAAHAGALSVNGKTIAVLGCGVNIIYPKQHAALHQQIAQSSCVVSELPLNTQPIAQNFPKRNRIISGLSLGTLIIEAAPKSGSLITARFALEQNREVFAVPGSPRNPMAKGCLSLIQEGAKCVTGVEDILNEISPPRSTASLNASSTTGAQSTYPLDLMEHQVLACIEEVTGIDQICARSKLSAQQVTAILLQLELRDVVKIHHNGYVRIDK